MDEQHTINLEHRLEAAKAEIKALQERIAYTEIARDNAQTQADEVQQRAKNKVTYAGRIIAELLALLRPLYAIHPELETKVKAVIATHTASEPVVEA